MASTKEYTITDQWSVIMSGSTTVSVQLATCCDIELYLSDTSTPPSDADSGLVMGNLGASNDFFSAGGLAKGNCSLWAKTRNTQTDDKTARILVITY